MAKQPNLGSAHAALLEVAQQGLSHVEFEVVRAVAVAVWHSQEVLSLKDVDGPHVGDAMSLVERLSFYNVVGQERKAELLGEVRRLREEKGQPQNRSLEATFRRFLPEPQPLQTRHSSRHG